MKTESEIGADIFVIMARIRAEFPELMKYLLEMPVRKMDSTGLGVSIEGLAEYHHSLINLVDKYAMEKPTTLKNK